MSVVGILSTVEILVLSGDVQRFESKSRLIFLFINLFFLFW